MALSWTQSANVATVVACAVFVVSTTLNYLYPRPSAARPGGAVPPVEDVTGATSLKDVATKSVKTPSIAIVEFSDFQCPYCGRHARETYKEIQREFVDVGKVSYSFRHLPLPNHPAAPRASEAAECAGVQGMFWEMHDVLFAPQTLDISALDSIAATLRLDAVPFQTCMDGRMSSKVTRDLDEAKRLGVGSTPTFLSWLRRSESRPVRRSESGPPEGPTFYVF